MAKLRGQTSTVTTGLGTIVASTTAPTSPHAGLRWYNSATGVTYQYTSDGTTSFWLDISSGGTGTSAGRSPDWAGDTDPLKNHSATLSGLAVGDVYYNRVRNEYFVCTDVTTNANVWEGRYAGVGGIETTFIASGVTYKIHAFKEDGNFYHEGGAIDTLLVGGGGGGGNHSGGGGGAGGLIYRPSANGTIAAGVYKIVIGQGNTSSFENKRGYQYGSGDGWASETQWHGPSRAGHLGVWGSHHKSNTTGFGMTAIGGGGGSGTAVADGRTSESVMSGGSGGGGARGANVSGLGKQTTEGSISADSRTYGFGNAGAKVSGNDLPPNYPGHGGGGAGAAGAVGASSGNGGAGGAGRDYSAIFGTTYGESGWFAGGGGGNIQSGGGSGGAARLRRLRASRRRTGISMP